MRRFGIGVLCAIAGYLIAAIAGYALIAQFSSNVHDRSVEAAMTSIFVFGPAGAVIGFIVGFIRARRPGGAVVPPT
jgi:predicted MFS family arabinose efflux permease